MTPRVEWFFKRGLSIGCGLTWPVPDEWYALPRPDQIARIKAAVLLEMSAHPIDMNAIRYFLDFLPNDTVSPWQRHGSFKQKAMRIIKAWMAALLACISTGAFAQVATFDVATGILTLPTVKVGTATYTNVLLGLINPANYTFRLQVATPQVPAGPANISFNGSTGVLIIPSVQVGSATFINVTLQITDTNTYTFILTAATLQPPSPTVEVIDGCEIRPLAGCQPPIAGLRDKCQAPFSPDSIWNVALSRSMITIPAGIGPASQQVYGDDAYWVVVAQSDPTYDWVKPADFSSNRCSGTQRIATVPFPTSLIVPDVSPPNTYNNSAAVLRANGRTITQMNALTRCAAGSAVFGYPSPGDKGDSFGTYDIYSRGTTGGHGGSGLSSIGGTTRLGELLSSSPPIAHALKVEIFANKYLFGQPPYHIWPAIREDSYAGGPSAIRYNGNNPSVRMGSLLVVPESFQCSALRSVPGQRICAALKDFGGYIVDDSAWDTHSIVVERGVKAEFAQTYGYDLDSYSSPFRSDINDIFVTLHVVTNNTETTVGGGGEPRRRDRAKCLGN